MTTNEMSRARYWTTLSEYEGDEEFRARVGEEFSPGAKPQRFFDEDENSEQFLTPIKRRTFLKFSGFAALAAALQGCERPVQKIIPYVSKPEDIIYGQANYYASCLGDSPEGLGLLVKTREGRPVKLEGNPEHPLNRGALGARDQASLLDLYNPDRLRFPMRVNRAFVGQVGEDMAIDHLVAMEKLDAEIGKAIRAAKGKVVYLSRPVSGRASTRLLNDWRGQGSNFEYIAYDPTVPDTDARANQAAFELARPVHARLHLDKAAAVVTLGGDPLGGGMSPVACSLGFAERRRPDHAEGQSRIHSFESIPTLIGMKADYRHQVRPSDLLPIALAIANVVVLENGSAPNAAELARDGKVRAILSAHTPEKVAADAKLDAGDIRRAAKSLQDNAGKSVVVTTGSHIAETEDAMALHLAGVLVNYALGNYGSTITLADATVPAADGGMNRLLADMHAGKVDVLVFNGVNPVYTMPKQAQFAEALKKVGLVVSLDRMMTETAAAADIIVPGVHSLEAWGDAEPASGVYTIQQPAIRRIFGELAKNPVYDTRSWQESLMAFATASGSEAFLRKPTDDDIRQMLDDAGTTDTAKLEPQKLASAPTGFYAYMREAYTRLYQEGDYAAKDFDTFWLSLLRQGVLEPAPGHGDALREPALSARAFGALAAGKRGGGREVVLYTSPHHGDGYSMGNPHLLELPDPASKITWENYAAISPAAAEALGVREGDHVGVTVGGVTLEIPTHIQPGVHVDVVAVMLGWGREVFGGIGEGCGVNAYPLALARLDGSAIFSGSAVTIQRASGNTRLADTQGHNYLYSPSYAGLSVNEQHGSIPKNAQKNEQGKPVYDRPIIGETTLDEWKADPFAGYPNETDPGKKPPTMWGVTPKYVGHHWGMSIDLNACIGCNACIVACSLENNVPVVGKEEVIIGREMHWIRIDRYYRGDKNNPDFAMMPVMCQHCDNAPCETVCPVIATMHNDEGLNVMIYNRCVGTRYCSNNCPYKVRRFNFWQYSDYRTGPYEERKMVSPLELVLNPDITARSKGVMEKCTFCIGRIRHAKDEAREKGRPLRDGEMKTACQQTCPAQAIHFGDRNDSASQIAAEWKNPRAYGLLTDLNTDPSVRYMTMVRNRDESSPYRTKFQAHRMHEKHLEGGQGGTKDDEAAPAEHEAAH